MIHHPRDTHVFLRERRLLSRREELDPLARILVIKIWYSKAEPRGAKQNGGASWPALFDNLSNLGRDHLLVQLGNDGGHCKSTGGR